VTKIGFLEISTREICAVQVAPGQIAPCELQSDNVCAPQIRDLALVFSPPLMPGVWTTFQRIDR
jgi:hypothetical protein